MEENMDYQPHFLKIICQHVPERNNFSGNSQIVLKIDNYRKKIYLI